jgi:HEAT repeat protein
VCDQQLDLFSGAPAGVQRGLPRAAERPLAPERMDDDALIGAIGGSTLDHSVALAAEAGRRRLAAAVPALAVLCRRFAGFGIHRLVPEQAAALCGLAMIGSREAAQAVASMLERAVVQGPTLAVAVDAAAQLRSVLSVEALQALLRHADPSIRADACRCARPGPQIVPLLIDLLDDLDRTVAMAAAYALAGLGRTEARPLLKRLLREEPSEQAIDAISTIADEECMVLLGRIARSVPALTDAALDALESIDHARAAAIAAAIRPQPQR